MISYAVRFFFLILFRGRDWIGLDWIWDAMRCDEFLFCFVLERRGGVGGIEGVASDLISV